MLVEEELRVVSSIAARSSKGCDFRLLFKPYFLLIGNLPPYTIEKIQGHRLRAHQKSMKPARASSHHRSPRREPEADEPSYSGQRDSDTTVDPLSFSESWRL